jgi:hypothetical protein
MTKPFNLDKDPEIEVLMLRRGEINTTKFFEKFADTEIAELMNKPTNVREYVEIYKSVSGTTSSTFFDIRKWELEKYIVVREECILVDIEQNIVHVNANLNTFRNVRDLRQFHNSIYVTASSKYKTMCANASVTFVNNVQEEEGVEYALAPAFSTVVESFGDVEIMAKFINDAPSAVLYSLIHMIIRLSPVTVHCYGHFFDAFTLLCLSWTGLLLLNKNSALIGTSHMDPKILATYGLTIAGARYSNIDEQEMLILMSYAVGFKTNSRVNLNLVNFGIALMEKLYTADTYWEYTNPRTGKLIDITDVTKPYHTPSDLAIVAAQSVGAFAEDIDILTVIGVLDRQVQGSRVQPEIVDITEAVSPAIDSQLGYFNVSLDNVSFNDLYAYVDKINMRNSRKSQNDIPDSSDILLMRNLSLIRTLSHSSWPDYLVLGCNGIPYPPYEELVQFDEYMYECMSSVTPNDICGIISYNATVNGVNYVCVMRRVYDNHVGDVLEGFPFEEVVYRLSGNESTPVSAREEDEPETPLEESDDKKVVVRRFRAELQSPGGVPLHFPTEMDIMHNFFGDDVTSVHVRLNNSQMQYVVTLRDKRTTIYNGPCLERKTEVRTFTSVHDDVIAFMTYAVANVMPTDMLNIESLSSLINSTPQSVITRLKYYVGQPSVPFVFPHISRTGNSVKRQIHTIDMQVCQFFMCFAFFAPKVVRFTEGAIHVREWAIFNDFMREAYINARPQLSNHVLYKYVDDDTRTLRPHQEYIVNNIISKFERGENHAAIYSDVGSGKTFAMISVLECLSGNLPEILIYTYPAESFKSVAAEFVMRGILINVLNFNKQATHTSPTNRTFFGGTVVNFVEHDQLHKMANMSISKFVTSDDYGSLYNAVINVANPNYSYEGCVVDRNPLTVLDLFGHHSVMTIVDECHKVVPIGTARTEIALDMINQSTYSIIMTGTLIRDTNVTALFPLLRKTVPYILNRSSIWSAFAETTNIHIELPCEVVENLVHVPVYPFVKEAYDEVAPPMFGGDNEEADRSDYSKAMRLAYKSVMYSMVDDAANMLTEQPDIPGVMIVVGGVAIAQELRNHMIYDLGIMSNEIHIVTQLTSCNIGPTYDGPVRYALVPCKYATGYNLSRFNVCFIYPAPVNGATLTQLHGRINRMGTRHRKVYHYVYYTDILEGIYERQKKCQQYADAVRSAAIIPNFSGDMEYDE